MSGVVRDLNILVKWLQAPRPPSIHLTLMGTSSGPYEGISSGCAIAHVVVKGVLTIRFGLFARRHRRGAPRQEPDAESRGCHCRPPHQNEQRSARGGGGRLPARAPRRGALAAQIPDPIREVSISGCEMWRVQPQPMAFCLEGRVSPGQRKTSNCSTRNSQLSTFLLPVRELALRRPHGCTHTGAQGTRHVA